VPPADGIRLAPDARPPGRWWAWLGGGDCPVPAPVRRLAPRRRPASAHEVARFRSAYAAALDMLVLKKERLVRWAT